MQQTVLKVITAVKIHVILAILNSVKLLSICSTMTDLYKNLLAHQNVTVEYVKFSDMEIWVTTQSQPWWCLRYNYMEWMLMFMVIIISRIIICIITIKL